MMLIDCLDKAAQGNRTRLLDSHFTINRPVYFCLCAYLKQMHFLFENQQFTCIYLVSKVELILMTICHHSCKIWHQIDMTKETDAYNVRFDQDNQALLGFC